MYDKITALNANSRKVLRSIWKHDGISRIEIANRLDLDKSTITKITNKLLKEKIIKTSEMGDPGPQGGRRPVGLSIVGESGIILGVELRTYECFVLALDLKGRIKGEYSKKYEQVSFDGAIESLISLINQLIQTEPVFSIGIGLPGIVDHEEGIIEKSYPLSVVEPFNLGACLREKTGLTVLLENDANCGCWSEYLSKENSSRTNMLYLSGTLDRKIKIDEEIRGSGVGAGILINGRVLHGMNFSAGEFRSVFVKKKETEQFLAENRIDMLEELASNMAMIINTFNINDLVLGGDFHDYGEELLELFARYADLNWAYDGPANCRYRFSGMKDRDVAYGAGIMCLDRFYSV
ncbi:MAG: ROK family transcriptional regulator [Spirochaetales bacterium]|nr:ROK family transcriptional regulator [Spirochaetales bacterium]